MKTSPEFRIRRRNILISAIIWVSLILLWKFSTISRDKDLTYGLSNLDGLYQQPDCGVVINSGTLLEGGLGDEIDKHELVCRFNFAPTIGYEKDVGCRKDILVLGAHTVREELNNVSRLNVLLRSTKIVIIRPLNHFKYEEYINIRKVGLASQGFIRIFMGLEGPATGLLNNYTSSRRIPSTGFFGLSALSSICHTITVYGDMYSANAPYGYFGQGQGKTASQIIERNHANHDMLTERRILENVMKSRKIFRKKYNLSVTTYQQRDLQNIFGANSIVSEIDPFFTTWGDWKSMDN